MKLWKKPELDRELESYLGLALTPVALRREFSLNLRERLLGNFADRPTKINLLQSPALLAASLFSLAMLVVAGLRAFMFLFSLFGLLRRMDADLQQRRTTA